MVSKGSLFAKSHVLTNMIRGLSYAMEEDLRLRAKKLGLTYAGLRILWILQFEEKMTMTELSNIGLWDISTTYRLLSTLMKTDYLSIDNGKDARVKEISLTEKGRELIENIYKEDEYIPKVRILPATETIDEEKFQIFLEVGLTLCSKLVNTEYVKWIQKVKEQITNK